MSFFSFYVVPTACVLDAKNSLSACARMGVGILPGLWFEGSL
uniref:Uncharacterized protein n=1 Tax=Anguilla anguilla TaxID=7936 RepID=A0A0E9TMN8_ANGAN